MRLETRKRGRDDGLAANSSWGGIARLEGQARVIAAEISDALRTASLRALLAYWERLAAGRPAPARADLRPADIPRLLPHLLLLDVLQDAADFRIRLIGTHVVNGLGADPTGRRLSDLSADGADLPLLQLARRTADHRLPTRLGHHRLRLGGRLVILTEGLALPLSDNGRDIDRVLAGLVLSQRSNIGPLAAGAFER